MVNASMPTDVVILPSFAPLLFQGCPKDDTSCVRGKASNLPVAQGIYIVICASAVPLYQAILSLFVYTL